MLNGTIISNQLCRTDQEYNNISTIFNTFLRIFTSVALPKFMHIPVKFIYARQFLGVTMINSIFSFFIA